MTSRESGDTAIEELGALRRHDATPECAERIRARCTAALAARRTALAPRPSSSWRSWVEPALALGLGALYIAEAFSRALAVYR